MNKDKPKQNETEEKWRRDFDSDESDDEELQINEKEASGSNSLGVTKIVCLGDSITAGYPTCSHENPVSYPNFLQGLLNSSKMSKFEVLNMGLCGRTMLKVKGRSIWNEKAYKATLSCQPDVIIILLGANDSDESRWNHESYISCYNEMISELKQTTQCQKIFVMTPTPFSGVSQITKDGDPIPEGKFFERLIHLDKVINKIMPQTVRDVAKANQVGLIDLN